MPSAEFEPRAEPNLPGPGSRRLGCALLAVALALAAWQCFADVGAPWGHGFRDFGAGRWSAFWAHNHVDLGLSVTRGIPVEVYSTDPATGVVQPQWNWHHPPLYALYLAACAAVFGQTEAVLRIAHGLLFLLLFPAVHALVRRAGHPVLAGVAALLLATSPYVALFGPMVLQDGAVLAIGLATIACFQSHLERPSRAGFWRVAALLFVACSLDIPGYFVGPALFVLALASERRGDGIRAVLLLFPVTLVAFAVMAVHYGTVLGGPLGFLRAMVGLAGEEGGRVVGRSLGDAAVGSVRFVGVELGAWGLSLLAAMGLLLGLATRDAAVRRLWWVGIAAIVPGLLNCALFPGHAVTHAFWPLLLVGALAPLAAIVPLAGWRLWRRSGWPSRAAGACFGALTAIALVAGLLQTRTLLAEDARVPPRLDSLERLRPVLAQHPLVFSNLFDGHALEQHRRDQAWVGEAHFGTEIPAPDGKRITWTRVGDTTLCGNLVSPAALQFLIGLARQRGLAGEVLFALANEPPAPALAEQLRQWAEPTIAGDLQLFRFDLGRQ